MKEFRDIGQFVAFLSRIPAAVAEAEKKGLGAAGAMIEAEAKAEIGHYQEAAGPLPAWAELADSTKADRVKQGFSANDPLLRTGALRDSISHEVDGKRVVVGSDSDIAVYQELGTMWSAETGASVIPPRSFLGGAMFRKAEDAAKVLGLAVANAVAGKKP